MRLVLVLVVVAYVTCLTASQLLSCVETVVMSSRGRSFYKVYVLHDEHGLFCSGLVMYKISRNKPQKESVHIPGIPFMVYLHQLYKLSCDHQIVGETCS